MVAVVIWCLGALLALILAACAGYSIGRATQDLPPSKAPATAIEPALPARPPPSLVAIDIRAFGGRMRVDSYVDVPFLESLAAAHGYELRVMQQGRGLH